MTNFTTVSDPLELQILLEDQTATQILFQSYAATTTIDRMTWLACILHYVRGHVHKIGHNYNSTDPGTQRTKTIADWCILLRVHTFALIGLFLPKQKWWLPGFLVETENSVWGLRSGKDACLVFF